MINPETVRKITITLVFIFGMVIFGGMILLKVEVWAGKVHAEVETCRTSLDWEDYLYKQAVTDVIEMRQTLTKGISNE